MPQCARTAKTTQCENGMPVRMGLGTDHPTGVARGLPTNSVSVCDKVTDELGMINTTKTGVVMIGSVLV